MKKNATGRPKIVPKVTREKPEIKISMNIIIFGEERDKEKERERERERKRKKEKGRERERKKTPNNSVLKTTSHCDNNISISKRQLKIKEKENKEKMVKIS